MGQWRTHIRTCCVCTAKASDFGTGQKHILGPPVEVDESDCWVSLAEFAKSHPVWSEKVVALPSMLISRREVGEICSSVKQVAVSLCLYTHQKFSHFALSMQVIDTQGSPVKVASLGRLRQCLTAFRKW